MYISTVSQLLLCLIITSAGCSHLPFLHPSHPLSSTQLHKYTNTQTHKYTNTQIHSYTNTQLLTILHPSSTPLHWEWIRIDLNLLFIFISTLFQYLLYPFSSFFCNDDCYDQHLSVHHDVLCLELRKAEVRKSQKRNMRSGLKIPTFSK